MTILAGDIGGTKTLLQLADIEVGSRYDVIFEKRYISADWDDLTPMVLDFMQAADRLNDVHVRAACFGIAGPVDGRNARTTNLPWKLNADAMQGDLGIAKVRLINDFQSVGYGIEVLADEDVVVLNAGHEVAHGTRVIIGAGI